jgi:hypothetical protein
MMKISKGSRALVRRKILFPLIFLIIAGKAAEAKLLSNDLVDLHKGHWAYNATTKLIDKYGLVQGFPDHTFRGEKGVNRYEFSVIILNLIKYLEDKQKVSLKPGGNISIDYKDKSLDDVPKNSWAQAAIMDLKDGYNLILSPPYEKTFGGNKNISRYELAYTIDKVISLFPNKDSLDRNPYIETSAEPEIKIENKITPESWSEKSKKNIMDYKIMVGFGSKNDFKGLDEVNRYQLSIVLIKAIEYIEKNQMK